MPGTEPERLRVLAWPAPTTPNIQPYIELLYAPMKDRGVRIEELSQRRVLFGRNQLVHAHWPDSLLNQADAASARRSLSRLRLLLRVLRFRGIKLLWTAHNLHSHERLHPELEEDFWALWTRSVDGYLSLSESGVSAVRERFPALASKPAFVVPHGHYREAYPPATARDEARRRLGLPADAQVLLFFGQVRRYKNVPKLIAEFRLLDRAEARLLVAGKPSDPELEREILAAAGGDPRVQLALRFIEDAEVADLFGAADLTALPFSDILNSGSALASLSLDRPVLVPAKGAMRELADSIEGSWVTTYEGDLRARKLGETLDRAVAARDAGRPDLSAYEWDSLVDQTIEAYRTLIREGRR